MATVQQIQPGAVTAAQFADVAAHRSALPATYNEYRLVCTPGSDPWLALRPLFSLSYFLARHLIESGFRGASRMVVSSASSETAIGLAF